MIYNADSIIIIQTKGKLKVLKEPLKTALRNPACSLPHLIFHPLHIVTFFSSQAEIHSLIYNSRYSPSL